MSMHPVTDLNPPPDDHRPARVPRRGARVIPLHDGWASFEGRLQTLEQMLTRIETGLHRLEDRLWVAAYGCAAAGAGTVGLLLWRHLGL